MSLVISDLMTAEGRGKNIYAPRFALLLAPFHSRNYCQKWPADEARAKRSSSPSFARRRADWPLE